MSEFLDGLRGEGEGELNAIADDYGAVFLGDVQGDIRVLSPGGGV